MDSLEEAELCFPLVNNSCRKKIRSPVMNTVIETVVLSVTLLIVILNMLVIISISHYRQLHTTTNHLLLSLAVADFLIGFPLTPFLLLHNQGCLNDILCGLNYFLGYLTFSVSVGNMVLISIDRYMAICDPMFHSTKVTLKRVQLCVCLCWIFAAVHSTWILRNYLQQPGRYSSCYGDCQVDAHLGERLVDFVITFLGPISVIIVLYMRVFMVAVSQARAIRSHITSVTQERTENVRTKKSELKAARTLGVVVVVFLICSSPFYCFDVAIPRDQIEEIYDATSFMLLCFNSCLNPVIYVYFYPWFRKAIKHIVTLQILKPDSSQANLL